MGLCTNTHDVVYAKSRSSAKDRCGAIAMFLWADFHLLHACRSCAMLATQAVETVDTLSEDVDGESKGKLPAKMDRFLQVGV